MRLEWRPGNEARVEVWERGWSGGLGMRLEWRPGNEASHACELDNKNIKQIF